MAKKPSGDALALGHFLSKLATDDAFREAFNKDKRGIMNALEEPLLEETKAAIEARDQLGVFDSLKISNQNAGGASTKVAAAKRKAKKAAKPAGKKTARKASATKKTARKTRR